MKVRAPAKLNLRLVVLAREASGYHGLETLFCTLDLADELQLEKADAGVRLRVDGAELGPPEDNLVHRAAESFLRAAGIGSGVRIRLRKATPAGAGLGGGSSDAAATLLGLNRLHGEPLDRAALLRLASGLGSDVPFFLAGSPLALAWSRGERLLALPPLPAAPVLVAVPDTAVSTPEAYRALDGARDAAGHESEPGVLRLHGLASWDGVAAVAVNEFEAVIFSRHPDLSRIRTALEESGARIARLTGSGSALFGVYRDAAARDRAADTLRGGFPEIRLIRTATRGGGRG